VEAEELLKCEEEPWRKAAETLSQLRTSLWNDVRAYGKSDVKSAGA
jgi:hypothetical protein